jgi:peroxiredoxin
MPVEVGSKVPSFALLDAFAGERRDLHDALRRGPVVLALYKASCQASKTAMPLLERLAQAYSPERLTVWGVAQDSANVTQSFARRTGVTFPVLLDQDDYALSRAFDIPETPTIVLIDRDGTVLWQTSGFQKASLAELSRRIGELLGLEPVDVLAGTEDVPDRVPG